MRAELQWAAWFERTSAPPRPAFPAPTDTPNVEVLPASESGGTTYRVQRLPVWRFRPSLRLRRGGEKLPWAPPESARGSARGPPGASGEVVIVFLAFF